MNVEQVDRVTLCLSELANYIKDSPRHRNVKLPTKYCYIQTTISFLLLREPLMKHKPIANRI